jgi:cysteine desulfurase
MLRYMIYLDNAATTPVLPEVWQAMRPWMLEGFGNPSSAHQAGRKARQALESAREQIAAGLDCRPEEVLFTSGATEANNLALLGLAGDPPGQLIASALEHPCVIEPLRHLQQQGFQLDWAEVNPAGIVEPDGVRARLTPDTRLVALMLVNHETGAVQPVRAVVEAVSPAPVHCDAVQAAGKLPLSFRELGVASLSISGHKIHGPKGIGALIVRRDWLKHVRPLFLGGHQQGGKRPGTEPVALAVGLATALTLALQQREARAEQVRLLRQRFLDRLAQEAGPIVVNGPGSPYLANVSFPGVPADALLMALDLAGVACSTGSACSSGSLLPSPVLQAINVPETVLRSAMRFSFSHLLTREEIETAAGIVGRSVQRLREQAEG